MARKTSFYYSFLVLPADERRAIIAVWDFCRAVDDAVDEEGTDSGLGVFSPGQAPDGWRAELGRCYGDEVPRSWQGRALQPFIREFDLPRQAFEDVIDGVAMDLDHTRYQTFDELSEYCQRVASAVGMICIRIFRCESHRAREYALHLGIALQLTNILRDVKSDFARGRVYLPLDDLAAVGCPVEALGAPAISEPVRQVIAFECRRAREYYQRAVDVRPEEDRHRLVAAEIMRAVYFETLRRIERSGYDVMSERVRVPRTVQALIALRQWLRPS